MWSSCVWWHWQVGGNRLQFNKVVSERCSCYISTVMFTVLQGVQYFQIEVNRWFHNKNLLNLSKSRILKVDGCLGSHYSLRLVLDTIHFDRVCAILKHVCVCVCENNIVALSLVFKAHYILWSLQLLSFLKGEGGHLSFGKGGRGGGPFCMKPCPLLNCYVNYLYTFGPLSIISFKYGKSDEAMFTPLNYITNIMYYVARYTLTYSGAAP